MATYFYDGQIRRYLLQIIRLLSNFAVKYGDGTLQRIPVTYADPDRQVATILNQNSENTVQSSPRIAVYITDLELDTSRLADSSYVGKINIRERAVDDNGEYQNYQGNSYTVERLMPTPFKLRFKVDIWTTSTDQKLQVLEQILTLFNPSLEIQTTDNYVDWTSLTVVDLTQVIFSSRTVPSGSANDIDIATLSLETPIYISPPAKVKKLGVVTNIISNVFSGVSSPFGDYAAGLGTDPESSTAAVVNPLTNKIFSSSEYAILVENNTIKLLGNSISYPSWANLLPTYPGTYRAGLSRIYLRQETGNFIVGYFTVNSSDNSLLSVVWDPDTYNANDSISSQHRPSTSTFDAIIDPIKTAPGSGLPVPTIGTRYLILESIGGGIKNTFIADSRIQRVNTDVLHRKVNGHRIFVNDIEVTSNTLRIPNNIDQGQYIIVLDSPVPAGSQIKYELFLNAVPNDSYYIGLPRDEDIEVNQDWGGPRAWKNLDGTDFVAEENDIIEWDGTKWNVIFDADLSKDQILYLSNLFTNTQYKWNGVFWSKSFEGEYGKTQWFIEL